MEISNFKRDTDAIETGKWVDGIPGMGELRLKVRGIGSRLYLSRVAALSRQRPREDRNADNSLKPDVAIEISGRAVYETILLDWDGLTDGGDPVKYSKDLALEWCTNPDYRPFLDAVFWAAQVVERGEASVREELAKN